MEDEQFDLYEGLENFDDSSHSEAEVVEQVEKPAVSDDEDDFNLVVDDDSTPQQQEVKPVKRTKKSIYTRKYRIFYVGAPGTTQDSPINKIEFFVLLKNLPAWLDNAGLLDYVKNIADGVVFAKVLYNLYDGRPLGIALVEFSEISSCSTFLKHKSQIASMPMPLQVYSHLSSQYRQGIVSESLIKSACRHLSVPYVSNSSFCTSQQDMIEIEYERQQEELVKNGEYEIVTKTFPWFSYDLVSIMGSCNRMMAPRASSKSHRGKRPSASKKTPPPFSQFPGVASNRPLQASSGKLQLSVATSRSSSASSSSAHLESYLSGGNMETMGEKMGLFSPTFQSNAEGKMESMSNKPELNIRDDSTIKHESSAKRDTSKHELSSKYSSNRSGSSSKQGNRSPDRYRSSSVGRKMTKSSSDKDHKSSSTRDKSIKSRDKSRKRTYDKSRSDRSLERADSHKSRRKRSLDREDRRERIKKRDKLRHDKSVHKK